MFSDVPRGGHGRMPPKYVTVLVGAQSRSHTVVGAQSLSVTPWLAHCHINSIRLHKVK